MNGLAAAQGLALYIVLAWKARHLTRAPRDLPLRCVTACLACAAIAYPLGVTAMLHPASPAAPWLVAAQNSLLLATAYALDCFFLCSLLPREEALRRAARRALIVAAAVALMGAAAALTRPGTNMNDQSRPSVAVIYLALDVPIGLFLADALRQTLLGVRDAGGQLATGLKITSAGLALMIAGLFPLTAVLVLHVSQLSSPAALVSVGGLAVITGILVFLAAARAYVRHRRVYRQIGPLWNEFHRVFPEDSLSRVPSFAWQKTLSPWDVHRRYYRRVIECRDGLVKISPRLAPGDQSSLADRLLAALESAPGPPVTDEAVALAVPAAEGLDADAAELAALAGQISTARARRNDDLASARQPKGNKP